MFLNKVMVLDHSFFRRLHTDIQDHFDTRAAADFNLLEYMVRLFGNGGRTIQKLQKLDLANVVRYAPNIIILEMGTNDLSRISPELVGSEIDDRSAHQNVRTNYRNLQSYSSC